MNYTLTTYLSARSLILISSLLLALSSIYGQSSSVEEVYFSGLGTAQSFAPQSFTLQTSTTGCSRKLNSAILRLSFDTGEDYEFGKNPFTAGCLVLIEGKTASGALTFHNLFKPSITEKDPEYVNIMDMTNFHPEGLGGVATDHIVVTVWNVVVSTSFSSVDFNGKLNARVKLEKEYSYSQSGVTVSAQQIASPCVQNPVQFSWTSSCEEIPNYQLEILRLYNEEAISVSNTYGVYPRYVKCKVDWEKALRIETESPLMSVNLTVAEGEGYYIWRIRSIGSIYKNGIADGRNWGAWSSAPSQGATINFTDSINVSFVYAFYYNQFEGDKNWIYSRVFTEQLKLGEKMQYANGLQQTKQSQSKINTQDAIIVSQQVYDYYGRANISSLPVPLTNNAGSQMGFGYISAVLQNGGQLYGPQHFDENTNYKSPMPIDGGPVDAYYSDANPDRQMASAEHYPFVETRYGQDGRVIEQGGAGENYHIGSQHNGSRRTTLTFYASMSDIELVRLFGDEAEASNKIYKVVTIDPNNVQSASYINEKGETIATALINAGPNDLVDTLEESNDLVITDTIKAEASAIGKPPYTWVRAENVVLSASLTNNSLAVHYGISPNEFTENCSGFCMTCEYKGYIRLYSNDPDATGFPKVDSFTLIPQECTQGQGFVFDRVYYNLPMGTYTVERELRGNLPNPNSAALFNGAEYDYQSSYYHQVKDELILQSETDLASLYTYIQNEDIEGFYQFLGVPAGLDSGFVHYDAGCYHLEIPIRRCPSYDCPANGPDFEGFALAILDTANVGLTIHDFLPNYTTGQWNQLIYNMLNDPIAPYTCQQLWECWDALVQTYYSQLALSSQLPDSTYMNMPVPAGMFTYNLQKRFFECTGYHIRGFTNTDFYPPSGIGASSNYLPTNVGYFSHAYAYFNYTSGQNAACEMMMMNQTNSTSFANAQLAAVDSNWQYFYGCVQNFVTPNAALYNAANVPANYANNPSALWADSTLGVQSGYELCELKFDSYVADIIEAAHAANYTVQGDVDTFGIVISNPQYTTAQIHCLAQMLVDSCKHQCVDTSFYTFQHSFYNHALHISFPDANGECGPGYGEVHSSVQNVDYYSQFLNNALAQEINQVSGNSGWGCIDSLGNFLPDGTYPFSDPNWLPPFGNTGGTFTGGGTGTNGNGGGTSGGGGGTSGGGGGENPPSGGNGSGSNGGGNGNGGNGNGGNGNGTGGGNNGAGSGGSGNGNGTSYPFNSDSCTYYVWYFNDTLLQTFPGFGGTLLIDSLVITAGAQPYFTTNGCQLLLYSDIGANPVVVMDNCDSTDCGKLCVAIDSMDYIHIDSAAVISIPTCSDIWQSYITNYIQEQLSQQIEVQALALKDSYQNQCLVPENLVDSLWMKYSIGDHHFTLYRYDRAGNLVSTIPPDGVSHALLTAPSSRATHPNWSMVTEYHYNSLKQLVSQQTPDGGKSNFFYDDIGRLRFSQNAEQLIQHKMSYTKYDALARVIEVGEADDAGMTSIANANDPNFPSVGTDRVFTHYTDPFPGINYNGLSQRYLQNRVSSTITDAGNHTCYSYDVHGNVEWLIHYINGLGFKTVRYEYDLISNKVKQVWLQEGQPDQYMWRFSYDSDNRILMAETSAEGIIWERDARYEYYLHGPLKRVIIGEDQIQGIDYTYNLQGWLKAINHTANDLDPSRDGNPNLPVATGPAPDAFGMLLHYYNTDGTNHGDFYKANSPFNADATNDYQLANNGLSTSGNLYNGNISAWTSKIQAVQALGALSLSYEGITGEIYRYDELNRIKSSTFGTYNLGNKDFDMLTAFATDYRYDGNGNILELNRNDEQGAPLDALTYHYTGGKNQLTHVDDAINGWGGSNTFADDLIDQNPNNYRYDAIGNLVADEIERNDYLWNPYGKLKAMRHTTYVSNNVGNLDFSYDAAGNRVAKIRTPDQWHPLLATTKTYYVRDAQGNVLATYEESPAAKLHQHEIHLYGSDRLGIRLREVEPDQYLGSDDPIDPSQQRSMVIEEVMYDSRLSTELSSEEVHLGEYIILRNVGNIPINLANFEVRNVESAQSVIFDSVVVDSGKRVIVAYGDGDLTDEAQFLLATHFPEQKLDDPELIWIWQTEMVLGDEAATIQVFENNQKRDEMRYGSDVGRTAENSDEDSILYILKRQGYESTGDRADLPEYAKLAKDWGLDWDIKIPEIRGNYVLRIVDLKRYELKDHLSNVRVIVTDVKNADLGNSGEPIAFKAAIRHYANYYPFGMEKPAMVWDKGGYRYGFNGQEHTDEIAGVGNHNTALFWEYDTRLARRWNLDPVPQICISDYAVMRNNSISHTDILGDKVIGNLSAYNEVKDKVQQGLNDTKSSMEKLNETIKSKKDSGKTTKGLDKQLNSLKDRQLEYENILLEFKELEESSQNYNISTTMAIPASKGGVTKYNSDTKDIDVIINSNLDLMESLPHELKHAYQFEKGLISFYSNGDGGHLYDLQDEIEAYKRSQFLGYYSGETIDSFWMIETKGEKYSGYPKNQIDINTIANPELVEKFQKTYKQQLQNGLKNDAKKGKGPTEVIKDWQLYYK